MKEIVEVLIEKNRTIATMESCTGGFLVNEITNIDGSSNVLKFSAVTYSNEYKIKMGVDKELIDKYTVYSMEVAKEMSLKISNFTNSDYGVGITGKLNRIDENNLFGNDNVVFVSIYDQKKDDYFTKKIEVKYNNRPQNKNQVVEEVIKLLKEII